MTESTDPRLDDLHQQVESLTEQLTKLQERVALLESRPASSVAPDSLPSAALAAAAPVAPGQPGDVAPVEPLSDEVATTPEAPWSVDYLDPAVLLRASTLFGRTLVVLGGGFLLRALTDAGMLPPYIGVAAGLVYATVWLAFAVRCTGVDQRASASFHALAGAAIAFPLIAETTLRFKLIDAPIASCLLVAFCVMGTLVARRLSSSLIAWATLLGGVVTSLVVAIGAHELPWPLLSLLALAVTVDAIASTDKTSSWRWPAALALDLLVLIAISVARGPHGLPQQYAPFSLALVLAVASLAVVAQLAQVAWRSLRGSRSVAVFDAAHLAALVAALLYGASAAADANPVAIAAAGAVSLASAVGCYVVAFGSLDRGQGRGALFYYFGSAGLLLAVTGGWMLLGGGALAVSCLGLALGAAWVGTKYDRATLRMHAAVYLAVAVVSSGLAARCAEGLLGSADNAWQPVGITGYAAALCALACYVICVGVGPDRRAREWYAFLPDAVIAALAGWGVAGLAARLVVTAVANASTPDPGVVAALRTAVLAVLVTIFASVARRLDRTELKWLAYAVLGAGALKLLAEDLRVGRPATLFVALALYGGALFAAPRWMRANASAKP